MTWREELLKQATPKQRNAVDILESRGLVFVNHFGYENAEEHLQKMNDAMKWGMLYEHLWIMYGIA